MWLKKLIKISIITTSLLFFSSNQLFCLCSPSMLNPVTDIDWDCIFPIKIAGITIGGSPSEGEEQGDKEPMENPESLSPICVCTTPIPRIGITISLWEPARLIEVVTDPWCFPTIGTSLGPPGPAKAGVQAAQYRGNPTRTNTTKTTFFQVHYYIFPLWAVLELLLDFICLEKSGFDLAYITEVDPLWNDPALASILNPEAILFGNPVTQMACSADSLAAAGGKTIDSLFWCMGSWGSPYPLAGGITDTDEVAAAAGTAARMIYKLHRQLILWGTTGSQGLCGKYPMPIWRKSQYRLQIAQPVRGTCHVIGKTGLLWSFFKNPPVPGRVSNFNFMLWRKRDCCAF